MSGGFEAAALRAAAPVVTSSGKRLLRRWRPDVSPTALDAAAQQLGEKVHQQESLRLAELGVSRRGEIAVPLGDIGVVHDIVTVYAGIDSRRMMLTGAPGSGKTVAALELLLGLLERRGVSGGPVPVRVNAAGWDGDLDAAMFFAQRISEAYPSVRRPLAAALLATRRVIVVLDGVDEMDPPGQPPRQAAQALKRLSEDPARDWPLVVLCRDEVYQQVLNNQDLDGQELAHATRIKIGGLNPDTIAGYLRGLTVGEDHARQRFATAAEHILTQLSEQPESPIAEVLQSPWMLSLTVDYLRHSDQHTAEELIKCPTTAAVTNQLFTSLIPHAVNSQRRDRGRRRYTETDVNRWLTTLANYLAPTVTRRSEIALHELWPMAGPTKRTRRLHTLVAGLTNGLTAGLTFGMAFGLTVGPVTGPVGGLMLGLTVGLAGGIAGGRGARPPIRVILRTGRRGVVWHRIQTGLTTGLTAGLTIGLTSGLTVGLTVGLTNGLTVALAIGLILGLAAVPRWAIPPQLAGGVIRRDWRAGLVISAALGLVFGVTTGLTTGLAIGLAFGLAGGLTSGQALSASSVRYAVAAFLFSRSGHFASRPAQLLDWATRAGLLRITGIRYQFRHETYREWLASQAPLP